MVSNSESYSCYSYHGERRLDLAENHLCEMSKNLLEMVLHLFLQLYSRPLLETPSRTKCSVLIPYPPPFITEASNIRRSDIKPQGLAE
jgi:hypothetical protein